jgi:hypothetical protein
MGFWKYSDAWRYSRNGEWTMKEGDVPATARSRWGRRDDEHAAGAVVMIMGTVWGENPTWIYYKLA